MADNFGREWVVRVLFTRFELERNASLRPFVELLARTGAVRVPQSHDSESLCFDVPAPAGVESHAWARSIETWAEDKGVNAVAAPQWPPDECERYDDVQG